MTEENTRIERGARLQWVPIPKMRVSPVAQRDLVEARVNYLAANLNLEELGAPTVNERDGFFYIIDGQHRIEALKEFGLGDQKVQCWTYRSLTEQEEAAKFRVLNNNLNVTAFDRFRTGVTAGWEVECDVDRIVRSLGMVVSRDEIPGAIHAPGTLIKVYNRAGGAVLARDVRLARDSFGDSGMDATVIDGFGFLCQRYNGQLDDATAVEALSGVHGGVHGLLGKAEAIRRNTGKPKGHCVAAAAVEIINGRHRGKKLPSWWKS